MVRRLPQPRTASDEYAAALHDRLGELLSAVGDVHQLLRDRLPSSEREGPVTGTVRLTEPAVPAAAPPVEPEPEPVRLVEPARPADPIPVEPEPAGPRPTPPPRSGKGSGLGPWRVFADHDEVQVPYTPDDSRDDIIAACERAGVLDGK
jgi:hypothetical protein